MLPFRSRCSPNLSNELYSSCRLQPTAKMASRSLVIIYNADATIMGKLKYGYRKLSSSGPEAACAACDITHGGLSLKESPKWLDSKKEIEKNGLNVVQLHRDELDSTLKDFVKSNGIRYPTVLLRTEDNSLNVVMSNTELNDCGGQPHALVEVLRKKAILPGKESPSSSL